MKRYKMLFTIITCCTLFLQCSTSFGQMPAPAQSGVKYRYIQKHKFRNEGTGKPMQYIFLPIPPGNDYQDISNIDAHDGEIFDNPGSSSQYVRYTITEQPPAGKWGEVVLEFDYIPHDSEYRGADIGEIIPYDTTTALYKLYTAKYHDYLDTSNPVMIKAARELWQQSENVYDFAFKCYQFVINNFDFKYGEKAWYSISELIANNGGDCGNLSSLVITLLRCGGVPARYVTLPGHVWAEFYLQDQGWVPIDPTLHLFGRASSSYQRLIWANENVFHVRIDEGHSFNTLIVCQHHYFYPDHNGWQCEKDFRTIKLD